MRTLTLAWEYPPIVEGGLARHVRKLSEGLVHEGVDVHVLTRGSRRLATEEERHGVLVHRIREREEYPRDIDAFVRWVHALNASMRRAGSELCQRLGIELVHSHDWLVAEAAEALARQFELAWVVTLHATEHGRHQGWVQAYPQSHIHAAERRMVHRADRLITCSQYMRAQAAAVFGLPARRVSVIPNGIDPADLQTPEADLPALRTRLAPHGELLVLLVGRLVHEKGFHLALDALARVIQRRGDVRYVVAGSGLAEAELKEQASRLGIARDGTFLGWIGDNTLHALYRVADLCIVPSIYEPFGLVPLEAMAAGCLCAVADTGGLREVVPDGGGAGSLRFRPNDPGSLAELMERVLADEVLRARLVSRARQHVLRFDWTSVARETAALYAALGGAARGALGATGRGDHRSLTS